MNLCLSLKRRVSCFIKRSLLSLAARRSVVCLSQLMRSPPATPQVVTAPDTQWADTQWADTPDTLVAVMTADTEVAITGAMDRSMTLATVTTATAARVMAFPLSAV